MDGSRSGRAPLTVAIGGLGAVGLPIARWLDAGEEPGLKLAAVSAQDRKKAADKLKGFRTPPELCDLEALAERADVVVECAPPGSFLKVAQPAVAAGRILVPFTATKLLENWQLVAAAKKSGARIIVPTGALVGLDAIRAAAEGEVAEVVMATRKPPAGLMKAKFVVDQGLDLSALEAPKRLYAGSVADAAALFPANVNVAVALSLAGIGPEKTRYEIWADPGVDRNTHRITVEAASTRFEIEVAGVPTEENPATGKLTPLSGIATLRGLVSTLKVGT